MAALEFIDGLLGWNGRVPNMADAGSSTSRAIAERLLNELEITRTVDHVGQTAGTRLEEAIEGHLHAALPSELGGFALEVGRKPPITGFSQYSHLATLESLIEADETRALRASIGRDYVIKPDVTVGLRVEPDSPPLLHACIPCKWTLRSDRAQNVRHEAVVLIRQRRGRLPHITPVTAEPQPTRIASLARGTAEIDAVYHLALGELQRACEAVGNREQTDVLDELVGHRRLRDLSELAPTLSV